MFKRIVFFTLVSLLAGWVGGAAAATVNILANHGVAGLGFFSGALSYTAIDAQDATLTITLTNNSPAANGGYLTGLAFNNPANDITGVSLAASPAFQLLGAAIGGKHSTSGFQNGINAAPYGNFDIGASTSNSFQGGGHPNAGLRPGQSQTFIFSLTGTNLNNLTAESFTQELSSSGQFLLAQFRGFNNGLNDKVPGLALAAATASGSATQAPIPSALVLVGSALVGLAIRQFKKS